MTSILMIAGLFAGIAVCMSTLYSVAQAMMREGAARWAHVALVLCMLFVMGALLERAVPLARIGAVPLLAIAVWVFTVERGMYRLFPGLVQLFAVVLIFGFVALNP